MDKVVDVPVWLVSRVPLVQAVMMTVVIPQLQLVVNLTLASMKTSEAPQLLFVDKGAAHGGDELLG